tara:strand:+ start:5562 stop:6662 length:1101 start_codon:yes stop_codon:yes gene_type:complete
MYLTKHHKLLEKKILDFVKKLPEKFPELIIDGKTVEKLSRGGGWFSTSVYGGFTNLKNTVCGFSLKRVVFDKDEVTIIEKSFPHINPKFYYRMFDKDCNKFLNKLRNYVDLPFYSELINYLETSFKEIIEEWKIETRKVEMLEKLKIEKEVKKVKSSISEIFKELDKNGDGVVDVIENDDFNLLIKKHQKKIIEIDRNYIQKFVKISTYLKIKKDNIQLIFNSIKEIKNETTLNKYVEILKDDLHSYNLLLLGSINMIISIVDDDMITFFELYEKFDNLNIFDSKHEKDISNKLSDIGFKIDILMNEVVKMSDQISNSLYELSNITKESSQKIINELGSVNSSMRFGNFLQGIQIYQNYKTNKRLK